MRFRLLLLLALVLGACDGAIGDGPSDSGRTGDAGSVLPDGRAPLGNCSDEATQLQIQVEDFLDTTCAHAGCHGPVGALYPFISGADLPDLVASGYFVPDDPTAGLMRRIDPVDPTYIMPPTRDANPPETIAAIRRWLELGAPTNCVVPPPRLEPAPNSLDQEALFQCSEPVPFEPTMSLMTRDEFVHRAGGVLGDRPLLASPFTTEGSPFSTATQDSLVSATLLSLHLDTLLTSSDTRFFDRNADGTLRNGRMGENASFRRWQKALSSSERTEIACLTNDARPAAEVLADDACKRRFVGLFLERFAFQRRPAEGEIELLLPFLDEELASETERADRLRTQAHLADAALLLPGALYRPALGDENGLLTPDEWSHALASALSTASLLSAETGDVARPELGWVHDYLRARDAGELDSPGAAAAFIRRVLDPDAGYVGGEHDASLAHARPDLYYDYREAAAWRLPRRGRYWLAPQIARFFREYFGYGGVSSVAKDDPAATSRWGMGGLVRFANNAVGGGYVLARDGANPDRPPHGEPHLVDQLDDMIARTVITAERSGRDVFAELLTNRTYRVPASLTATEGFAGRGVRPSPSCDPRTCTDCCPDGLLCMLTGFAADGTPLGGCAGLSYRSFHYVASVYDVNPIEESRSAADATGDDPAVARDPSHMARWVEMRAGERAGVLTHPAWLSMFGANEENGASAVLRGHWIREHLFCEDVAGLELVQLDAQLSETGDVRGRDRILHTFGDLSVPVSERTHGDPRCSNGACHARMNNLGLAFEVFNHAGFRRFDDHGQPPDGRSVITHWPGRGPVEVDDAVELVGLIAEDPHARRCFLRHVFRFFAGRNETMADACVLAQMEAAFAGGSFFAAVEALLTHESFLARSAGGE